MNNAISTTWAQRLVRYGLNALGGLLSGLGLLLLFSDTPIVGAGWLPAGLLLIPRSRHWLQEKVPVKITDRMVYGIAAALWMLPMFGLTVPSVPKPEREAVAPKTNRAPETSLFSVTVEVSGDMLLCLSKHDLNSVARATDPLNEKLKRDYANDAMAFGRIVSDPGFAQREMAAIGFAQTALVSAGKCIQPKSGSWVSTSRWGLQDRKPIEPIEVDYQNRTYWAHAAYFKK